MSEQKQFDVPEVLAALEAAVAKRGEDYVYERPLNGSGTPTGCLYVHDRGTENPVPGCIVGQVYYDLTGQLVPFEVESSPADGIDMRETGVFTQEARDVLQTAQAVQDDGAPWGVALAAAKRAAGV